ncbi:MAG: DciA family protein [Actinomycetes bacterium]
MPEDEAVGGTDPDVVPRSDSVDLARAMLARARATARERGSAPGHRAGPTSSGGRRSRSSSRRGQGDLAASGAFPDERDPQPVGSTLERLVGERGWEVPVAVGGVEGRWAEIVGPELAAHCQPEGFDEGVLTVRADSSAWATQVRLLAATVVRRLNEVLGDGTVRVVSVVGPDGPSWRKGRLRVPGRGPRDTYG